MASSEDQDGTVLFAKISISKNNICYYNSAYQSQYLIVIKLINLKELISCLLFLINDKRYSNVIKEWTMSCILCESPYASL